MIFFVLNFICAISVFSLSFLMDLSFTDSRTRSFVNMLLLQALSSLIGALCVLFILFNQQGLVASFGRFFIWIPSIEALLIFVWCCRFPDFKRDALWRVIVLVVTVLSFYLVFFLFDSFSFDAERNLVVISKPIWILPVTWFSFYRAMVVYVLPFASILVLLFKYELFARRILRQQALLFAVSLFTGQLFFLLIHRANTLPGHGLYIMLLPFAYALVLFLFYRAQQTFVLYNIAGVFREAGFFVLMYVVPSLATGFAFTLLLPFIKNNRPAFFLLAAASAAVLFFIAYSIRILLFQSDRYGVSSYADRMEEEFAALDFSDIDMQIDTRFAYILQKNLNTTNVIILTENDEHKLVTRYSSNGSQIELDVNNPVFSSLLNIQRRVVFKTHCDTVHEISPFAPRLYDIFEQTGSEVMILLNEGAYLFGMVLLGSKKLEQPYTDYDYETFNALYSRFFLTGYYLKNIANEELVNLVGREIRFSSQVIQSLHKKTDVPSLAGCDADSFSLSARSLGSGFTDFIKLDARRYIGVIGDLSGKGLNASMLMAILKTMVPVFLAETKDFKALIQKVNSFIRENLPRGTYFSGLFCLIDMQSKTVYYANCALAALFMYNRTYNNMIEIQGEGRVLGFAEDISSLIKVKKVQLSSGDLLVGVTNGLLETKSLRGDSFGKARVQRVVLDNIKQPAKKLCDLLSTAVREFADKEMEEDASALIIKIV